MTYSIFRILRVTIGLGLTLSAPAGLSGCSTAGMAETSAQGGGFFGGGQQKPALTVPVFIVSTRKGGTNSTELTPGAQARYALNFISVPPGHASGVIEAPNFGGPDPERHFTVASRRSLDDTSFEAEVAAHVSGRIGVNRDVLIYVHGFNTSFEEARFRLAQIVVDGEFGGVPILFTWPSKSALLAYGADRESATASRDAYFKLLNQLAETPGIGRIHILAHSMGTWLTMETLREEALSGAPDLHGHLGDVMLAAPDIDLSVFKQQVARLDPSHFSVFVSKGDRALQVSASLQGDRRLGAIDPGAEADREMIDKLGVKVYDISDLATNLIGHDSYTTPQVVRSIGAQMSAPRQSDGGPAQAVIDAGADRSAPPPVVAEAPAALLPAAPAAPPAPALVSPNAISSEPLPPPVAAAPATPAQ